jgi:hypothetical protein
LCILQRISPRRIRTSATDTSQFTMDRNRKFGIVHKNGVSINHIYESISDCIIIRSYHTVYTIV